jgi:hypothetical protein
MESHRDCDNDLKEVLYVNKPLSLLRDGDAFEEIQARVDPGSGFPGVPSNI